MGNSSSNVKQETVNTGLLGPALVCDETYTHDVTIHHTTQKSFKRCKVLQLIHVDRRNELRAKLVQQPKLTVCLEKHFQISDLMKNVALPLKFKHPSILSVYSSLPDPVQNALFLIVEDCIPLHIFVKKLDVYQIVLGIRSLLSGLEFVHNHLQISHNNIRVNSIFVNSRSRWKICGFELCLAFKEMGKDTIVLLELLKKMSDSNALAFHRDYPFAYDMFCLGRLVVHLAQNCTNLSDLPAFEELMQVIGKSCLGDQPQYRLSAAHLLAHAAFQHPLVLATEFLDDYMGLSDRQKIVFFSNFNEAVANRIPLSLLCKQVLPRLFESNIFLDSPSRPVLTQLLRPYGVSSDDVQTPMGSSQHSFLPGSAFQQYLLPLVLGKWRLRERGTRLLLLDNFEAYHQLISPADLRETVLPQVCIGLYDQDNCLAGLSLSALGLLTRVLGAGVVLDTVRSMEVTLRQTKSLPVSAASPTAWPRAHLFAETAPKLTRQSREVPVSEQRTVKKLSLAQLAALSSHYEPDSNPVLREACWQELVESAPRPTSLADGLVKVNPHKNGRGSDRRPNCSTPPVEVCASNGMLSEADSKAAEGDPTGEQSPASDATTQLSPGAESAVPTTMRYLRDEDSGSGSDGEKAAENCWDVNWDFEN